MSCDKHCLLCDSSDKQAPAIGWQLLGIFLALAGWAGLIGELLKPK